MFYSVLLLIFKTCLKLLEFHFAMACHNATQVSFEGCDAQTQLVLPSDWKMCGKATADKNTGFETQHGSKTSYPDTPRSFQSEWLVSA